MRVSHSMNQINRPLGSPSRIQPILGGGAMEVMYMELGISGINKAKKGK